MTASVSRFIEYSLMQNILQMIKKGFVFTALHLFSGSTTKSTDRLNVVNMMIVVRDLNLTQHRAFIFIEDRFLVSLCATKDQKSLC